MIKVSSPAASQADIARKCPTEDKELILAGAALCAGWFCERDNMSQRPPFEQGTVMGPEQLSALLDSIHELIAILSPQGNILFANAGFTRMLGYRVEPLVNPA